MPDTQDRILMAAVQLFARRGLHGTTTSDIAQTAGVGEATLFRWFPSKKKLFRAAVGRSYREMPWRDWFDEKLLEQDFEVGTRQFGRRFAEYLRHHDIDRRLLIYAALQDPAAARQFVDLVAAPMTHHFGSIISAAVDRGVVEHPRPYIAARILIDALLGTHTFLVWFAAVKMSLFNCPNPEDTVVNLWLQGMMKRR